MNKLSEEIAAYEEMRSTLEADYSGKWVVIHKRKLIGIHDNFGAAADEAVQKFGRGPYLIRQVNAPPATLPASLLYRPVLDHA